MMMISFPITIDTSTAMSQAPVVLAGSDKRVKILNPNIKMEGRGQGRPAMAETLTKQACAGGAG
jgi:hypothetical protein